MSASTFSRIFLICTVTVAISPMESISQISLMVSAKKDDIDKIRGLGLGADDYMTKPFSHSELVARVKAHMASTVELQLKIYSLILTPPHFSGLSACLSASAGPVCPAQDGPPGICGRCGKDLYYQGV